MENVNVNLDSLTARLLRIEDKIFCGPEPCKISSETPKFDFPSYATVAGRKKAAPAAVLNFLPAPISTANRFDILRTYQDFQLLEEKKTNAVVIGLPEDEDRTQEADDNAVRTIVDGAQIGRQRVIRTVRKGKAEKRKARPMLVQFDSETSRNTFIQEFRKHRPENLKAGGYCRRDFTATELAQDKSCRMECRRRNCLEGKRRWIIRDLQIIEAQKPWPDLVNRGPQKDLFQVKALAQPAEAALDQGDVDQEEPPIVSMDTEEKKPETSSEADRIGEKTSSTPTVIQWPVVAKDPDKCKDESEENRQALVKEFLESLNPRMRDWHERYETRRKCLNDNIFHYHRGTWEPIIDLDDYLKGKYL